MLKYILRKYISEANWKIIIRVFVEEYKRMYSEDNDATGYINITDELKRNFKHLPDNI